MMLAHTEADKAAIRRGHRRHAVVQLWNPNGYVADLPYTKGAVTYSVSTGQANRRGTLTVPGYEWFDLVSPAGQTWVDIYIELERQPLVPNSGSSFHIGQFPIVQTTVTRPGGEIDIQLGDWSFRRSQHEGEAAGPIPYTAMTVKAAVEMYMGHVTPGGVWTCTQDDSLGAMVVSPVQLSLGGNVWNALTTLCNQVGCHLVTLTKTTGQIRKWDMWQPYMEDLTGTVVTESFSVNLTEMVNRVIVTLEGEAPGSVTYRSEENVAILTQGPYAYSRDGIGVMTIVETVRLPTSSQAAANTEAWRIYDRRVGMVQEQKIEIVPTPWIQLGDALAWYPSFTNDPRFGVVDSYTFPLTANGKQSVTLRDQTVK